MDEILNKLGDVSALSAEEIEELGTQLTNEFQSLQSEELSPEVVDAMNKLASGKKALSAEVSRRATEAKELSNAAEIAAQVFNTEDGADDEETDVDENEATEEETTAAVNNVEDEEVIEDEIPLEDEVAVDVEPVVEEIVEELPAEEVVVTDEAVAPATEVEEAPAEDETVEDEEVVDDEEENPLENFSDKTETESEETNKDEAESASEELSLESEENVSENVNTEFSAPDNNAPVEAVNTVRQVITAGADLKGLPMGSEIPNFRALAASIIDRRNAMGRTTGGDGEQSLVASVSVADSFPAERSLYDNDTEGNMKKVKNLVASIKAGENVSLVAAGGLLGPVDTSWDIYELGETLGRPVKDSLPSFKATRGGLRFLTPPVLEDLNGAVSVWTLQDDIDAAEPGSDKVKPCIRVKAGSEVTVYLEAMPLCLTFGNIGARAYPELVERHIALAMVWQARYAETRLLTRIGELSTQVTADAELGAARDILVQVDTAAAGLRSRHRLDPNAPLRAIFPEWFRKALRSDLVKQIPGDGQEAALGLVDSTIDGWFSDRGLSITWTNDGETGQILGAQEDGKLNEFPATVIWYLFPEGTFLFLEDATLDLGLVRDSTLNATNDYKMFLETFENVAKVGVESLRIESGLAIAGASAGTVDTITATP